MRKILLVLEDYNELLFLETLLKKVGFDVESIRNELSLSDKMMAFVPDLVIATGDGIRVNGSRVSKKVKRKGQSSKLMLLFPRQKLKSDKALEGFVTDIALETPINPRAAVIAICQLTGVNADSIMAKFDKLPIAKNAEEGKSDMQIISGGKKSRAQTAPESKAESNRSERFKAALENVPDSKQTLFDHQKIKSEVEMIRKEAAVEDFTEIDEERRAFVISLFKK